MANCSSLYNPAYMKLIASSFNCSVINDEKDSGLTGFPSIDRTRTTRKKPVTLFLHKSIRCQKNN